MSRTKWTQAQERVMDVIYADGYVGPCGHRGPQMVVDELGMVRCHVHLSVSHDHTSNPGWQQYAPDLHTPACLTTICGAEFWPVPRRELLGGSPY